LKEIIQIGCDLVLLDTSAWIEFFEGTNKGARVKEVLNQNKCYTSIVTLAEVTNWSLKEKRDTLFFVNTVGKLSSIINMDDSIVILAGRLNFERKKINKKWGMLDSFILATGMIYNLKILAKDPDYRDLKDVEIL
jgi:predicted nucleic acid-binding protein